MQKIIELIMQFAIKYQVKDIYKAMFTIYSTTILMLLSIDVFVSIVTRSQPMILPYIKELFIAVTPVIWSYLHTLANDTLQVVANFKTPKV